MPVPYRKCHECGRAGDPVEFVSRRVPPKNAEKRKGQHFDTIYLCPACAEKHEPEQEHVPVQVLICDGCGEAILHGAQQYRSRTEPEVLGYAARHWTIHMVLCPRCAARRDGTSYFVLYTLLLFVVAAIVVACGSLLFKW